MFKSVALFVFAACFSAIRGTSDPVIKPKETHVLGGFSNMDLSNQETLVRVQNVTKFAMKSLNGKSNELYHHNHIRILDAKSQVVAGSKFVINLYTGETTCAKNQVESGYCNV